MLISRGLLIIITMVVMIALLHTSLAPIAAGVITLVVILAGYIAFGYISSRARAALLNERCDPQAFLDRTEKQRTITGKNPRIGAMLDIDRAAGLICLGDIDAAEEVLASIPAKYLSPANGLQLTYTLNRLACLYERGKGEEAESVFEREMPLLSPIGQPMTLAVRLTMAERLYHLGRLDECREALAALLDNKKITRRMRCEILYRQALIEEAQGKAQKARTLYQSVARLGNKLHCARLAEEKANAG